MSGSYDPTDSTELTLRANRDTSASAEYSGEDIVETVYQASIRQRFLQRLYLSVAGGFAHDNYENNEPGITVGRRDDYYFYRTSLSCDVTRHGTIQLSYEHRENLTPRLPHSGSLRICSGLRHRSFSSPIRFGWKAGQWLLCGQMALFLAACVFKPASQERAAGTEPPGREARCE